jgi:hypothetical protein
MQVYHHFSVMVNGIWRQLLGIISMDFDILDQLLFRYSTFLKYLQGKMGVQWGSTSAMYRLQESI